MSLPIALQLYTVRDLLETQLAETCQKVREIGYTHVEIGPFSGHTTRAVGEAAKAAGLQIIGTHEGSLMNDGPSDEIMSVCRDLGIAYAIQPFLDEDKRSGETYDRLARELPKKAGQEVTVLYHNHDFEFEAMSDSRTGWQHLYENTQLMAEVDTAWVAIAGFDPVAELRKMAGRVPLLHIKDCSDFEQKTLCEVGTGKVPVADIIKVAPEVGAKCFVVEQDYGWIDDDPIKSIKVSFDNLKAML